MVQCEMCGAETGSPKTVKIEGAELDVCDDCADFGTEVQTQDTSSTSTKYSTSSSGSSSSGGSSGSSTSSSTGSGGGGGGGSRRDMFDEMDEVVQDYDDRIREAREAASMTQEELANSLNEKASLIRKLERGEVLPSDSVQRKLERELDISLSTGGGSDDNDWSGGSSTGKTTLGDVVKRKD
ncbi:cro/C1 family transcription regulator [Natronomonas pharaonis DSM 2160]|uniref:Cro/C1 family transcription regulator n=1 Tax=Natronomonas pharaonis (strain ATCC 35678 / DSM 2160 / CIP 103997 / JCM 8858 / NBRC 14720 / NCIMB 2260 / Gabara) TaxID=348780 RepID=A0A1U7EVS9_NATPD|nr:multiprotein bridging factor aMBF1 [Natronomonas pharaonis]CAI49164.1 cro/C1 family transcription regulator [Natronomonas pharaonis DSM 2160]